MSAKEVIEKKLIPQLIRDNVLFPNSRKNYAIKSCKLSPIGGDGTFMLSLCFRVKLHVVECEGEDAEEKTHSFDLVVKITPALPQDQFEACGFKKLFDSETLVYTKILPLLNKRGGDVVAYPKFHYAHVKPTECVMVLDDFGPDGWRMARAVVNLSLEHILLAVRYLGKFHGNCFALKEMKNDQFREIVGHLGKTRFDKESSGHYVWDQVVFRAPLRGITSLKNSPEKDILDADFMETIKNIINNPPGLCKELVQPVEPLAIICHGDYLRNNIAFKYSDTEVPIDVMMFDFQTMCHTSPMMDLVTFMANSTGAEVRQPNFKLIFAAYHEEVIKNVCAQWGKPASELPPYYSSESFLREYARLLPFGYCVASSFIPILHEPLDGTAFDNELMRQSEEEQVHDALTRGGETVDKELRALIQDMYNLRKELC